MNTTVSVKGQTVSIPAQTIAGHTIVLAENRWPRVATIREEEWQEEPVQNPDVITTALKASPMRADLFTFAQKLGDFSARFPYVHEWENLAVVPLTTYDEWWEKRLPQETRKNVRRAAKRGLVTRTFELDDAAVAGIKGIYDETPVRQGRRFWHYHKPSDAVKRDNSTYLDRSEFIGAFLEEKMVGFLKIVFTGATASIMQIVSRNEHQDKRPTNALIAKAVERSLERGASYFVYGQYVYGRNADSPLTTFKQRNGFEQLLVPRYYLPLSLGGEVALRLKAHRGFRQMLPGGVENALLRMRARFYQKQTAHS